MDKRADLRLKWDTRLKAERMAQRRHVIEEALDFARMPVLARTSVLPPIPANIVEVMRIAAGSKAACQAASEATGEPAEVLIEAARFYLQQLLFRPDSDSHRILGLQPDASRDTARAHLRWLLQWIHPDRNDGLESVYAERVIKAWRERSTPAETGRPPNNVAQRAKASKQSPPFRLPWIEHSVTSPSRGHGTYLTATVWAISVLLLGLLALSAVIYLLSFVQTAAVIAAP